MSAREILAYAITHAPRGQKGGPYEAESGPPGEECDSLRDACRWPTSEPDARECAAMYLEDHLSWQGDARVIRIVTAREILAYAITHAPKGVKGGPYEADDEGTWGTATPSLRPGHAVRWRTRPTQERVDGVLRHVREVHPHARVIRIVRKARPSRLCDACGFLIEAESRRRAPSEASAVEVLRELVAWSAAPALHSSDVLRIADSARAVLAASGPDPSEVVRAAMLETEAEEAVRASVAAKNNAPGTGPRWQAAVDEWLSASQRLNAARAKRASAVDAYRKAGGK